MTVFQPPAYATIGADTGYSTLAAAVATISTTDCTLILPTGAHVPPATIPDNIKLEFAKGAYLDLSAAPYGHPSAMANSAGLVLVTQNGHGLINDDRIMFWNITQCGTPSSGGATAEWSGLNFTPWKITKVNDNQFTLQDAPSPAAWNAYNAGVDAGQWIKLTYIQGDIIASKFQKIFNCPNGPAVSFGKISGANVAYDRRVRTVYPEWWGAVADCVYSSAGTDNINYFNLSLWSLLGSYNTRQGIIELPDRGGYKLGSTWCFDDIFSSYNSITVRGSDGTYLYSTAAGYPAIEIIPPNLIRLENFDIYGDATNTPTVGLFTARSLTDSNAQLMRIYKMQILGTYQYGGYLNCNCEIGYYEDLRIHCTTQNAGFQLGLTSTMADFGSVVPKGGTGLGSRVGDSCTDNTFHFCEFSGEGYTGGQSIYINGGTSNKTVASFNHLYMAVWGTQDVFRIKDGCTIQLTDITTEGDAARYFYNCSAASASYFTIIENSVSHGQGTYTLNAGADCRISGSILRNTGTINHTGDYFINNYVVIDGGFMLITGACSGNYIVIGSSVTGFKSPLDQDNLLDNHILDGRTFRGDRREFTERYLVLGTISSSGDDGLCGKVLFGGGNATIDCGSAVPSAGSWGQGSIRLNTGVTEHGSPGWSCYQKGTFGTLAGVTATGTSGDAFCTVNTLTGLKIGDYITIANERGGTTPFMILAMIDDGSTKKIYLDLTLDSTQGTPQAVAYYGPPLFHTMAVNA